MSILNHFIPSKENIKSFVCLGEKVFCSSWSLIPLQMNVTLKESFCGCVFLFPFSDVVFVLISSVPPKRLNPDECFGKCCGFGATWVKPQPLRTVALASSWLNNPQQEISGGFEFPAGLEALCFWGSSVWGRQAALQSWRKPSWSVSRLPLQGRENLIKSV